MVRRQKASGLEALSGTTSSFNGEANIPQSPDIYQEINTTLSRIDQMLVGTFDSESRSAVVLLRNEVSL